MNFTKTIFKYYDAAEKLDYERQSLVILKSHPVSQTKNESDAHYIRKILDYKSELKSVEKGVSLFEKLVSTYRNELLDSLKQAGVEPETTINVPISGESVLRVWYTPEGGCHYRKEYI